MGLKERVQEFRQDATVRGDVEAINKLLKRGRLAGVFGWDWALAGCLLEWGRVTTGSGQIQAELSHPGPTNPKTTLLIPTAQRGERIVTLVVTEDSFTEPGGRDVVIRLEVPFSGVHFNNQEKGIVFSLASGRRVATVYRNGASLEPGFRVTEPDWFATGRLPEKQLAQVDREEADRPAEIVRQLAGADILRRGGGKI